jgi:hypothetical protein
MREQHRAAEAGDGAVDETVGGDRSVEHPERRARHGSRRQEAVSFQVGLEPADRSPRSSRDRLIGQNAKRPWRNGSIAPTTWPSRGR